MLSATANSIKHNLRRKVYPDGSADTMIATAQIFREPGWEDALDKPKVKSKASTSSDAASSLERAKRRARSAVADLALSNDFRYFVTFTLDASKVDRYDPVAVTKKLNSWLDNRVRRDGLKYVLVPELHKDGAIHFHGFINDALEAIDSGTVSIPGQKPKKPRSAKIRAQMLADGGHIVYNLPQWTLGFTTAIELYGAKRQAVGYVTKYITKAQTKVGGRWYYHGGDLKLPIVDYDDVDYNDFIGKEGASSFDISELGVSVIKFTYTKEET